MFGEREKSLAVNTLIGNGAYAFSGNQLYSTLAKFVEPLITYGGPFGPAAFLRLNDSVFSFARQNGVPLKLLKEPQSVGVSNFNELTALVKRVVREGYGDSLNRSFIMNSVIETTFKDKYSKEIVFLVLTDLNQDEMASMTDTIFQGQPNFVLNLDEGEATTRSTISSMWRKVFDTFRKLGKLPPTKQTESTEETNN